MDTQETNIEQETPITITESEAQEAVDNAITRDEAIAQGKTIDFVFDDRPKVIRMWRRRGIFVFNCCQHDREF